MLGFVNSCPFFCLIFREILPLYSRRGRSTEFLCYDSAHSTQRSSFSNCNISRLPELAFDRLQLSDQDICDEQMRVFGRFVARGAALDEEYWVISFFKCSDLSGLQLFLNLLFCDKIYEDFNFLNIMTDSSLATC